MPAYDTPAPISANLELTVGDIRVAATDRADTVVEVRPSDPDRPGDVEAAAQTRVDFSNGRLTIKAPKKRVQNTFRNRGDSIDVSIDLPSGSGVQAEAGVARLACTGLLADLRYKAGVGDVSVESAGQVRLRTGAGDITVDRVLGPAEITTGSGTVSVAAAGAGAVIRNTNGDIRIGACDGDLRVNAANGKIAVGRSEGTVSARTANGDISLSEITGGSVTAHTGFGRIDLGIADGLAAWLDLHTSFGQVRSELPAAEPPAPGSEAVEVRARTSYGDITVAPAPAAGER